MRKVLLDRKSLLKGLSDFQSEDEVYFPELEGLFGSSKGEIPFLKIKGASLDDQIAAQTIASKARIAVVEMIKNFGKKEALKVLNRELSSKASILNEKTQLEISIFHRCVVQPMFSLEEVIWLSKKLPEVVNRGAKTALFLSSMERLNGDSERS